MTSRRPDLRHLDLPRPLGHLVDGGLAIACTTAYTTLVVAVRPLLVGRRLSVRTGDGALTLTVTRVSLDRHRILRVEAHDVSWREHSFGHAGAVLHDVHLRGFGRPVALVAGRVDVTVEVSAPTLDDLFRGAAPKLGAEVGPDGVARVHLPRRRGGGHIEVEARLDGATLQVTPRAVGLRHRRWALPAATPSYRVRVPELPHGLELTAVEFAPGVVRLSGELPQWRVDLPRTPIDDLLGRLGAIGRHAAIQRR